MKQTIDPRMLEILQHTVGANQFGQRRCDRNHYVAGADDAVLCRALVALGLMIESPSSELTGGDPLFRATDAGKSVVFNQSPAPPKSSRSAKRYAAFLNQDSGMKFGEWLRASRVAG